MRGLWEWACFTHAAFYVNECWDILVGFGDEHGGLGREWIVGMGTGEIV